MIEVDLGKLVAAGVLRICTLEEMLDVLTPEERADWQREWDAKMERFAAEIDQRCFEHVYRELTQEPD